MPFWAAAVASTSVWMVYREGTVNEVDSWKTASLAKTKPSSVHEPAAAPAVHAEPSSE